MIVHFVRPELLNQTELRIKLFFREINDFRVVEKLAIKRLIFNCARINDQFVFLIRKKIWRR